MLTITIMKKNGPKYYSLFLRNRDTRAFHLDAEFQSFMKDDLSVMVYCCHMHHDALGDLGETVPHQALSADSTSASKLSGDVSSGKNLFPRMMRWLPIFVSRRSANHDPLKLLPQTSSPLYSPLLWRASLPPCFSTAAAHQWRWWQR